LNRSLRKALLLWLLLPAGLALVTFLPLAFHLVHQPAMEALDRALADASLALVPHLEVTDGEPRFVFPAAAEQVLRADRVDDIYFLVLGPNGRFVAGDAGLPHEAPEGDEVHGERVSFYAHFRGHPIRVTAVHRTISGAPFVFVTAETTRKRDQLRVDLAFALLLPLLFFAGSTGFTIWFGVRPARRVHVQQHRIRLLLDRLLQAAAEDVEGRAVDLVLDRNHIDHRLGGRGGHARRRPGRLAGQATEEDHHQHACAQEHQDATYTPPRDRQASRTYNLGPSFKISRRDRGLFRAAEII